MPQRPSNDDPDLEPLEASLAAANNNSDNGKPGLWKRLPFSKLSNKKKIESTEPDEPDEKHNGHVQIAEKPADDPQTLAERRILRGVVPGLPRSLTLRREVSEKREKLLPHQPPVAERRVRAGVPQRRAHSAMRPVRSRSPGPAIPRLSAPEHGLLVGSQVSVLSEHQPRQPPRLGLRIPNELGRKQDDGEDDLTSPPPPLSPDDGCSEKEDVLDQDLSDPEFLKELESTWILNLTMRFRDGSEREKFIVTYAQHPQRWRRVTVSCDYRHAEPHSLESNLKGLINHRDKNAHIYEAIRGSLPEIQYFPSVTNLKLETKDHRLHVHVTEDVNEKIDYPTVSQVEHLGLRPSEKFREGVIRFESHLSGFVYKVSAHGRTYIKKEIPSPDTVEEFLYEIDALHRLRDSKHVIKFRGVVVDDNDEYIKGLLIDYAPQGSLADIIYDHPDYPLDWARRAKWAEQIVRGLADIHEHGFVQGDFTLSNIVIDAEDNVKIIDINRRGCPVGWEPPEFLRLIQSGRRVSMFIGVKSDVFQMGMCLWGLAELIDEPDREETLDFTSESEAPRWFQQIVNTCLDDKPSRRLSAKELLRMFSSADLRVDVARQPGLVDENSYDPACRLQAQRESLTRALAGATQKHTAADSPCTDQNGTPIRPPLHQDSGFADSPGIDLDLGPPPANGDGTDSRERTQDHPASQQQANDLLAHVGGAGEIKRGP